MRRVRGVLLAVVAAAAVGCGADAGEEPTPGGGDPATVGLSPPGTPLAAGLVVPVGAQLVGPVFPVPADPTAPVHATVPTSVVAVMQVDGDPFAAWDDLAGQAQRLGVMIHGSGNCLWRSPSDPAGTPVAALRPVDAVILDCRGYDRGPLADGLRLQVEMNLVWGAAGAEFHIQISEGDTIEFNSDFFGPDPGPAPASAVGQLPDRDAPTAAGPGDPFGRENNCFERGYDRLTVPDGSRLVGGGTTFAGRDFAAVLAVGDPRAVLEDLRDQLDDEDSSDGHYRLAEVRLADGALVWSLSGLVDAGGGTCAMWSSPDGTAVLVTTTGD